MHSIQPSNNIWKKKANANEESNQKSLRMLSISTSTNYYVNFNNSSKPKFDQKKIETFDRINGNKQAKNIPKKKEFLQSNRKEKLNKNRQSVNLCRDQRVWSQFQVIITQMFRAVFGCVNDVFLITDQLDKFSDNDMNYGMQRSFFDGMLLYVENWSLAYFKDFMPFKPKIQLDFLENLKDFKEKFDLSTENENFECFNNILIDYGCLKENQRSSNEILQYSMEIFNDNMRKKIGIERTYYGDFREDSDENCYDEHFNLRFIQKLKAEIKSLEIQISDLSKKLQEIRLNYANSELQNKYLKIELREIEHIQKTRFEEEKLKLESKNRQMLEKQKTESQAEIEKLKTSFEQEKADLILKIEATTRESQNVTFQSEDDTKWDTYQDETHRTALKKSLVQDDTSVSYEYLLNRTKFDPEIVNFVDFMKKWDCNPALTLKLEINEPTLTVSRTTPDDKTFPFAVLRKPLKGHLFFRVEILSIEEEHRWFPVGVILESELLSEKSRNMEDKSAWGVGTMWFAGFSYTRNFIGKTATNKPNDPKGHAPGTVFFMEYNSEGPDAPTIKYLNKDGHIFLSNKPLPKEPMYLIVIVGRLKNKLRISMINSSEVPGYLKSK